MPRAYQLYPPQRHAHAEARSRPPRRRGRRRYELHHTIKKSLLATQNHERKKKEYKREIALGASIRPGPLVLMGN